MKKINVRYIAVTAMFAAVASVLMFLEHPVPFMPSFIKLDVSELPALIASFGMGPVSGMLVCLIKNLVNLPFSQTTGVGELCNFLLGCFFVIPAGLIYKYHRNFKSAIVGSIVGAVSMAVLSLPLNYFVTYPFYMKFLPLEAIIGMYKAIIPSVNNLFQCLLVFNVPFTLFKGLIDCIITFAVYKRLSPLMHDSNHIYHYSKPNIQHNIPKCPTCGSTNVHLISNLNRAGSVLTWELSSSKIGKTYECLNCKYKW